MSLLSKTRILFAAILVSAVLGAAVWNAYSQGSRILQGLSDMSPPASLAELRTAGKRVEAQVNRHLEGKYEAWDLYARIQQSLGKSEMNDFAVIKADDGRLYRGGLYPLNTENSGRLAEVIADFAGLAGEQGTKVLYMNTPDAVIKGKKIEPGYMPYRDYNAASDALLYGLRERGVPFIDTRYSFLQQGFGQEDISPRTTFLMSAEASFAAFGYLLEGLERKFNLSLDPDGFYRDGSNYTVTTYPDFFMGELGKETDPSFGGLADFKAVTPDFETEYVYEALDMFGNPTSIRGDAQTTLLHPDALVYYENIYRLYPQSYYKHTNTVWSKVVNLRNPGGPKILVLHDYYTAQVLSHLAPLCGEMHTLAHQDNLFTDATRYIKDNRFDYIIISFLPQNLVRPEMQRLIAAEGE